MTVTESPEWTPSSEDEKKVKDAFSLLNTSNDKAMISVPGNKSNRFILHSKGYFDLQAYVLTGKEFPSNGTFFELRVPRAAFRKLTDIDATIYDKTKDAIVTVGQTCSEYYDKHLSKLVTAASTVINYSDNSIELLQKAQGINLRHQLNILLDSKYKSKDTFDDTFEEAKAGAKITLSMLSKQAKEKKKQVDEIVEAMQKFKMDTMKNLNSITYLRKQYQTGPVENTSNQKTPYLEYLNTDMNSAVNKLTRMVTQQNDKYGDWKQATGIAIGLAFCGPIGWVVMGFKAAEAVDLREAYENLMSQVDALKRDNKQQLDLITWVTQLVTVFKNLDEKIVSAITAMGELGELFRDQAACYDKIHMYFDGMETAADTKVLASRKDYIDYNLGQAIIKLKELKEVAEEFTRSIVLKDTEKMINSLLPPDKQVKFQEFWRSVDEKQTAEAQKVLKKLGINITINDVKPKHVDKAKKLLDKVRKIYGL